MGELAWIFVSAMVSLPGFFPWRSWALQDC
jgi:hypothetical protein